MKKKLKELKILRAIHTIVGNGLFDFRTGRVRSVIFVGLGNIFPDFIICGTLRALLWKIAGAKINDVSTAVILKWAFIEYACQLKAGTHLQIGRGTYFCAHAPITLGDHVTISLDCKILTMHHTGKYHEEEVFNSVEIGSHSIIYAGATILPGSSIVAHSIIGAGEIVRRK